MGSGTGGGDWINYHRLARVVKLVDTRDLKSRRFRVVPVRPRPRAPLSDLFINKNNSLGRIMFSLLIELVIEASFITCKIFLWIQNIRDILMKLELR